MIADERFSAPSRLLHWLMALLVLAMPFIGVGMAASASGRYSLLLSVHRPLGIAILVLVAIRFINRLINRPPPLPATLPPLQRLAAKASHFALYALMFALPLVGWGMLSAGGYPIVLYGPVELPPISPTKRHPVRRTTPVAHGVGLSVVRHIPCPCGSGAVPWTDPARRRVGKHGDLDVTEPVSPVGQCLGMMTLAGARWASRCGSDERSDAPSIDLRQL